MSMLSLLAIFLCLSGLVAIVIAVAVVWMQNRQEDRSERQPNSMPAPAVPRQAASIDVLDQIRSLMAAGNKIEAIKVYRAATGVGLKEAKDAVEALERGELLPAAPAAPQPLTGVELGAQVSDLLIAGKKIEAIKRYRAATGASLSEAKEAVEGIERNEPYRGYYPSTPAALAALDASGTDLDAQVYSLLQAGKKLDAIKVYRAATNTGLKDAKDVIDQIEQSMKLGG